jgi:hypothetical protein
MKTKTKPPPELRDLARQLRRLQAADTDLKKKNAKRACLVLLRRIKELVVPKRKPKNLPVCPLCTNGYFANCRIFASWVSLIAHLVKSHHFKGVGVDGWMLRCPCGYMATIDGPGRKRMATHLANQKDLKSHIHVNRVGGNTP